MLMRVRIFTKFGIIKLIYEDGFLFIRKMFDTARVTSVKNKFNYRSLSYSQAHERGAESFLVPKNLKRASPFCEGFRQKSRELAEKNIFIIGWFIMCFVEFFWQFIRRLAVVSDFWDAAWLFKALDNSVQIQSVIFIVRHTKLGRYHGLIFHFAFTNIADITI